MQCVNNVVALWEQAHGKENQPDGQRRPCFVNGHCKAPAQMTDNRCLGPSSNGGLKGARRWA
jgi:hypothetical protein